MPWWSSVLAADGAVRASGEVEKEISEAIKKMGLAGLIVAAKHKGETKIATGYGLANIPFNVAANESTLFHIGSVGKQMTATAVLMLNEAGAVDLDKPARHYIKDLPEMLSAITVRHLLHHTSGIPDYDETFEWDRAFGHDKVLALTNKTPLFAPGEAWSYSNTGYILLGWLIAAVSGMPYEKFIQERLFARLGTHESRIDDASLVINNRAEGYMADETNAMRFAPRMESETSKTADGPVLLSARDWPIWANAFMSGKLLKEESRAAMTSPAPLNSGRLHPYGFAWFLDRVHGKPVRYHSGSVPGFISYSLWLPESDLTVFISTNTMTAKMGALRNLPSRIAEALAPGSSEFSLDAASDGDAKLTSEAKAILTRGETKLDAARFAPEMQPFARAGGDESRITRLPGGIKAFDLVEEWSENKTRVRRYRADVGGSVRFVRFGYAQDNRICFIQ